MNKSKAAERIEKLLKLSESPNENEAASALAMAHKIARKYQIDFAHMIKENMKAFAIFDDDFYFPKWKLDIASVLAHSLTIKVFVNTNTTYSCQNLELHTDQKSYELFLLMYNFTIKSYEILLKKYLNKIAGDYPDLAVAGYHRKLKERYLAGFIEGLEGRLKESDEEFSDYNFDNNESISERTLIFLENSIASKTGFSDAKSLNNKNCLINKTDIKN